YCREDAWDYVVGVGNYVWECVPLYQEEYQLQRHERDCAAGDEPTVGRLAGVGVQSGGDVDGEHRRVDLEPGSELVGEPGAEPAPEEGIDHQAARPGRTERDDRHAGAAGGIGRPSRGVGAGPREGVHGHGDTAATEVAGGHVAVSPVVAGTAQDRHLGPVGGTHLYRLQGDGPPGAVHEDIDGIGGALIHTRRLGGGDDRDHARCSCGEGGMGSCSPTATAMTSADVSVWVMVTSTSVTPSISARRAAFPLSLTRGGPPPVISMSVQRMRLQPTPIDFITASLPAKRAARRRAGLANRKAYSLSWGVKQRSRKRGYLRYTASTRSMSARSTPSPMIRIRPG